MKIVTVVGARPQFIKAAVVSRELSIHGNIREVLVHTGQHYDAEMSDVFFDELSIPRPNFNLGIGGGSHGAMTGAQLTGIEGVILDEKPDWVLVYGDTNSTLAGALAAAKLHVPVAHVEAGLRSFNRRMPEEINRVLTDHVSKALFAPTDVAMANLAREGIEEGCFLVGDVMFDAAIFYGEQAKNTSRILEVLGLKSKQYALVTVHRAENTDDSVRLKLILSALSILSEKIEVVWPVHPRTRRLLQQGEFARLIAPGLHLVSPVGYLDMVILERNASVIATDSGGVQKEAYFHGVPCVTLRDETEWIELVEAGWNKLCPVQNSTAIAEAIHRSVGSKGLPVTLYGQGSAARLIVERLRDCASR